MRSLFQSLLLLLASATDRALARWAQYLKAENQILRSKLPKRIPVAPKERQRLLKYGQPVGPALKDLISIVTPRTFARWLSGETGAKQCAKPTRPGRPRTPEDIRDLVLRLARENAWGYTRILGELKKLGVRNICRSTVNKILKENGLEPGPTRGEGTWDDFLRRHAQTLWATDFFSKKVWTSSGLLDVFVLFFINLGTRKVFVTGVTAQPDKAWMKQQARNAAFLFADEPVRTTHLLRDHDTKFVPEFDAILASEGMEVKRVGPIAPNLNAVAERFVQTVKGECLDHFVVFGVEHLQHILKEYLAYYHQYRPHQGLGNVPPDGPVLPSGAAPPSPKEVRCEESLGGLLKHYSRAA